MPHALSSICQHNIGGAGTRMLCTEAVVCWLWCVRQRPGHGGAAVSAAEKTNFDTWIQTGFVGPPAKARASQVFLGKMATAKGTHKTSRFYQSNPQKGAIVIWLNSNVADHVAINGGNNILHGYNQNSWLDACGDTAQTHCHHNVNKIIWDENGLHAQKSFGNRKCGIYYVGPKDAMAYFNKYVDEASKW